MTRGNARSGAAVWILAIVVGIGLAGCGGGAGDSKGDGEKPFRVGLVFDVGGKGDKSFNDSAYEGVQRVAAEIPLQLSDFEPGQDADREVGLRRLASRGYDVVIGVGFLFTDAIGAVAAEFPDVHFILVDGRLDGVDNVASLVFREQEGSFLVGAIAAWTSKTGTLGFVGGMDVPLIHRFEAGYGAGARHVRPDVEILVGYAGVRPEAFADPVRGKEIGLSQISRGADVIFHASGVTGLGVIEAAKERGVYAIGVDANQNHVAPGTMLTSMIKRVDNAIYKTVMDSHSGRFQGGLVEFGLADDGVGYALDEYNRELIPADMVTRLDALRQSIIAGEIVVPFETGRR
ncbi:MAG: BMP family ABC transporter substrate-binding protein [Gemmatimonadota bacterium]|nr:MAG: BMP family ABC transporter substrate-binding protein [Gemmatimonadota bacterium]